MKISVILVQFRYYAIIICNPHHPHSITADKGRILLSEKLPVPPISLFLISNIKLYKAFNMRFIWDFIVFGITWFFGSIRSVLVCLEHLIFIFLA